jgi:hypothetical protein
MCPSATVFHAHTVPLPDILLSSSLYLSGFCFQRNLEIAECDIKHENHLFCKFVLACFIMVKIILEIILIKIPIRYIVEEYFEPTKAYYLFEHTKIDN